MRTVGGRTLAIVLPLVLGVCRDAHAETSEASPAPEAAPRGPLFYPEGPGKFRFRGGVGLLVDVLPTRVVESELRQFPQLTTDLRFGLKDGLSLDARVQTIVISNHFELGAMYALHLGKAWVGLENHVGYWLGTASLEGFEAVGTGWTDALGIRIGIPMDHVRFTFSTDLIATFAQTISLGDSGKSTRQKGSIAGTASAITVETMLDSGGDIFFGIGALYTLPDYQAWIAFSDDRARILYPRLFGGYAF